MDKRLTPSTLFFLLTPPVLWAGNSIVGRMVYELIPPITLNFFRWSLALLILLPFGWRAFKPEYGLLSNWRRYSLLGLLGIGSYNGLQYLALHTSTAVNVTLVGASMPIWMLVVGAVFFRVKINRGQFVGAVLSIIGVLLVLAHGSWSQLLSLRFVIGDLYMLIATLIWAFYSWFLTHGGDSPLMRSHWASLLLAQVFYGAIWSGVFAGAEWALIDWKIHWNGLLIGSLIYVVIGPALLAYRCWGVGVQRVGPSLAAIFYNLTPLLAAVLSAYMLNEPAQFYHAIAFVLIISGIILSARSGPA